MWTAWSSLCLASLIAICASFLSGARGKRARVRILLTLISACFAVLAACLALVSHTVVDKDSIPVALVVIVSLVFAIAFGGPLTELIFRLASRQNNLEKKPKTDPSPLRGGLWIGLLERSAIVATLWAGWPEGIAVVLAVKGLGRFAELKNHQAAEQFILGTFSSCLVAAASYGLGLLLLG